MCGIAGMAGTGADRTTLARMTAVQRHRGPDGDGLWHAEGIALGHRRLKIIDLSEAGKQPMATTDGRYTIVYNGEVYNFEELRAEITDVHFRSRTDTEVVLQAYAHWGPDCLTRFVGMYAFAIWDSLRKELFCARDRFGIKPFYYALQEGSFLFSSEIRALLAAGVPARVNQSILYDFLARDYYEHTEETFFHGIYKLPPGCWMRVRAGSPQQPRSYWDLATAVEDCAPGETEPEREEAFLELATRAVASHLKSDVPVGVALSGGLDSATLLSLLAKVHPDPTRVESFSFVFSDRQYSERPFIEAMLKQTGQRSHFVQIRPRSFAESVERLCSSQEEPFAGAPIMAYASCFEAARQAGFIVMMDGSGLDECLGGYERFYPALWADLFQAGRWRQLARELSAKGLDHDGGRRRALERMSAAARREADVGRGQDLTSSVRPECLHTELAHSAAGPLPDFDRPFPDHLRNLMYRELRYTKLPRALRFRDRLSMAVGTELRPPFLDHRLVAYEFSLPPTDMICHGTSKAILRRVGARFLPDTVRLAAKRSVQTPQREWFRKELADWVRERIDTPSFWRREWIDRRAGRNAMEDFLSGHGDNSFFLWQWINLEIWAQEFLDRPHPG